MTYSSQAFSPYPAMQVTTHQGVPLTVAVVATQRIRGGHLEPIVEFRYPGGILCCSFYLSVFEDYANTFGRQNGLLLEASGRSSEQSISAATVQDCADFIARECQP